MEKSLLELAFEFVQSNANPVEFKEIWDYVVSEKGLSEEESAEKISRFYTNLSLDGRFVTLGDNKWDLSSRHVFDERHIPMGDVYSDIDIKDVDSEEEIEEKEYNKAYEDNNEDDDSGIEPEEFDE